jgi:hypothetical protein
MKKTYNRILSVVAMSVIGLAGAFSTAQAQSYLCPGDSICLEAPGARGTVTWYADSGGGWSSIGTGTTFCDIPPGPGTYWLIGGITEGTCDTIWTDSIEVIVPDPITFTFGGSDTLLLTDCNGTLSTLATSAGLTVTGGIAPYSYSWSPGTGLSSTTVLDPDYAHSSGLGVGYFTLTLTVTDSVGCSGSTDITIWVDPQGVSTFNFTGGIQTFTVPACVDTVFLQAWGGQGGSGATGGSSTSGGAGGLGGYAEGWLLVAPGDVLNVFVGGQGATPTGGFNGGANGGSTNAGGGGGASDVRVGGTAEANRVLTAGGGGGGGRAGCETSGAGVGGAGGSGGGGVGANGGDSPTSGGVAGGGKGGNFSAVQGAAGPAGAGCGGFLGSAGGTASTGTGASGGAGQSCCCFSFGSIPGGGGGGGGQVGGGGGGGGSAGTTGCSGNDKGAGGGGGGGSSYTGGVLSGATNSGIWLGNGMVTISW